MATIRQRANRWQCIIKRKGYPLQSKTFDIKKDAEKWARQQEGLIDSGKWVDHTEAERTTVHELLERYAREVSARKRGAEIEAIRLNTIKRSSLARHSVAAITGRLITQWRDQRLTQVSGSTVAREMTLLSHVFTVAIREWSFHLHCNPMRFVKKPASAKPRDRVLTDDERTSLISSCTKCHNPWIRPVVIFALETAARRGEIIALTWDSIDLQHGTSKLSVTKSGQPRTIPLTQECIAMLRSLPRSLDGRVFPVTVETLKQAYARAVTRAGIDNFTFHDLRHDALTRLAKLGLNVLELRAISGHTTANMLQRYVSIDARELSDKLDKLLRASAYLAASNPYQQKATPSKGFNQ